MKQTRPLSYSSIKAFSKSPTHLLKYWERVFKPTPAMALGSLVHTLVLEPDQYENRYFCIDDEEICLDLIARGAKSPRANGEYKAWKANLLAKAEDKEEVSLADFKTATALAARLKNHPLIKALTFKEELIEWELNGVKIKGFVDGAGEELPEEFRDFEGQGFILDLKTTKDASPSSYSRDVVTFMYHLQSGLYKDANRVLNFAGVAPKFYHIAIETAEPFIIQTYEISSEFSDKGYNFAVKQIELFKEWDGEPAGYEFGNELAVGSVLPLNAPSWI